MQIVSFVSQISIYFGHVSENALYRTWAIESSGDDSPTQRQNLERLRKNAGSAVWY